MEPLILGSTATWKFLAKLTDCEPSFVVWRSDHDVSCEYVNTAQRNMQRQFGLPIYQTQWGLDACTKIRRYEIFSGASSIIVLSESNAWSKVLVLND